MSWYFFLHYFNRVYPTQSCYHVYMKLLTTLRAEDVEPDAPTFDYTSFKPRTAVRAIVFDEDKIALIHVKEHDYYMLPGGGVENEDIATELHREILEELGCEMK